MPTAPPLFESPKRKTPRRSPFHSPVSINFLLTVFMGDSVEQPVWERRSGTDPEPSSTGSPDAVGCHTIGRQPHRSSVSRGGSERWAFLAWSQVGQNRATCVKTSPGDTGRLRATVINYAGRRTPGQGLNGYERPAGGNSPSTGSRTAGCRKPRKGGHHEYSHELVLLGDPLGRLCRAQPPSLRKIGIRAVDSDLATLVRTADHHVVLSGFVWFAGKWSIPGPALQDVVVPRALRLATGAPPGSATFRALQAGEALERWRRWTN